MNAGQSCIAAKRFIVVEKVLGDFEERFEIWMNAVRVGDPFDEAKAIAVANDSAFGLGGGVFTRYLARGERIAAELIESGSRFVNKVAHSDLRLPFGGVKESGYGRELSSYGIRVFVNIKTVLTVALSERLAATHLAAGQCYLAAPVFGRPDAAAAGKLFVVAGGEANLVTQRQPVFDAVGQRTFVIGDTPAWANLSHL